METHRYAPESEPPENLALDEDGRQVVLEHDPGAPVIGTNPDGTETRRPRSLAHRYGSALVPADPARDRSARHVLQHAVARLLQGMVVYQEEAGAVMDGLPAGVRAYCLKSVFEGWPRPQEEPEVPSAMVVLEGDVTYDETVRRPGYVEETWGRWGAGTVLRRVGSATAKMEIVVWCADKEQRDAIDAAVERQLLADPVEDIYGRRIVLPEYYDQGARIGLLLSSENVTPETVLAGEWPLRVVVQAEIDRVILVKAPPSMATLLGGEVGPTVDITT